MKFDKYLNRAQIAEKLNWTPDAVRKFLRDMQESGRYPPDELIVDGKLVLIHEDVVLDWMMNRKKLKHGDLVPPYRRRR